METAGSIEWSDGDADQLCHTFTVQQSFFTVALVCVVMVNISDSDRELNMQRFSFLTPRFDGLKT